MRSAHETGSSSREPTTLPGSVESPNEKLVYLYLATHGGASLPELQDSLDLTKLTLYSVLGTLRDAGLVARESERYVPA